MAGDLQELHGFEAEGPRGHLSRRDLSRSSACLWHSGAGQAVLAACDERWAWHSTYIWLQIENWRQHGLKFIDFEPYSFSTSQESCQSLGLGSIMKRSFASCLARHAGDGIESEPYRMYNLDVFEYLEDSPFGLYGTIPLMLAHKADSTVGVFW